jgi:small subunit ribosomal protein S6
MLTNRHYEVLFLVHPDQSEQINSVVQRYRSLIENHGGKIHRLEDWGRRPLAYPIKKNHKAHYILMNIECDNNTLNELKHSFRFSEFILRNLILKRKEAITVPSAMMRPRDLIEKPGKKPYATAADNKFHRGASGGTTTAKNEAPNQEEVATTAAEVGPTNEEGIA